MIKKISAVLALVYLMSHAISAEGAERYESSILLYTNAGKTEADDSYAIIINDFLNAAFAARGISTGVVTAEDAISTVEELLAVGSDKELADFVRDRGHDFILTTLYELGPGRMELRFSCIDSAAGQELVSGEETARPLLLLDAALDLEVKAVMSGLLDNNALVLADETISDTEAVVETTVVATDTGGLAPKTYPAAKNGFSIAPAFALFQTLGAAAGYFTGGIKSTIAAHYRFVYPFGSLSPGLYAGTMFFETVDAEVQSGNFLTPFAVDVQYATTSNGIMDLQVFVSGGGALFSVGLDQSGYVSKVLPYARGGMGFLFFQGQRVSLGIDAGVEFYFENPRPIVGYSVGINVGLSQK